MNTEVVCLPTYILLGLWEYLVYQYHIALMLARVFTIDVYMCSSINTVAKLVDHIDLSEIWLFSQG